MNFTSVLEINTSIIRDNYLILKQLSKSEVAAAVKANAYGLGATEITRTLINGGCDKFFVATLNEAIAFNKFLELEHDGAIKLIAHCLEDDKKSIDDFRKDSVKKYLILIGPEGDFTEDEINFAKQKGFIPLSLGDARLRTETAAIKATALIAFINE